MVSGEGKMTRRVEGENAVASGQGTSIAFAVHSLDGSLSHSLITRLMASDRYDEVIWASPTVGGGAGEPRISIAVVSFLICDFVLCLVY